MAAIGHQERGETSSTAESRRGVARNATYLALGQLGTTVLGIALSAALGRGLGAGEFGLYFLALSMAAFVYVFIEWGQPAVVTRETARQPELAGDLLGTALVLRLVSTVLAVVPLLWSAVLLGYDRRTIALAVLYFAATLPAFLSQAFTMVFRGRDRMEGDAAVSVFNKTITLVLVVAVLARGGGLVAVAIAQAVAGIASLAFARCLYAKLGAPPLRATWGMARRLWTGGAPIVAVAAAAAFQPYLDAVILSKLVPSDVMGWYAVAKNILGTLLAPAVILGSASFPQLSRAAAEPARFREEVRAALRVMLMLGALGAAGTYLFAGTAVRVIYGRAQYQPAATILEVFSPGMFLLFVDVLLGTALFAASRVKRFALAKIASVGVSVALDLVLIPVFQHRYGNGGIGVLVAFAASELVVFGCALTMMPRGSLSASSVLDGGRALAAGSATVLLARAAPGVPPSIGIPLVALLFCAIAYALGLVRRSDVALLTEMVSRRRPSSEA